MSEKTKKKPQTSISATGLYEMRSKDIAISDHTSGLRCVECGNHLHYHVELVYMLDGNAKGFIDFKEHSIVSDSMFIVFPNQIHSYKSESNEKYFLFIISPSIMPELQTVFDSEKPRIPVVTDVSKSSELTELIGLITREYNESPDSRFRDSVLHGYFIALFSILFRKMELGDYSGGDTRVMRSIIDFCVKNYNRDLSLDILSKELHVSKYYISHLFGSKFNMRFNDYINSLRISEASRYLYDSDKSITEISNLVGFATQRTFDRAFRKQLGMSPSEYRKYRANGSSTELGK